MWPHGPSVAAKFQGFNTEGGGEREREESEKKNSLDFQEFQYQFSDHGDYELRCCWQPILKFTNWNKELIHMSHLVTGNQQLQVNPDRQTDTHTHKSGVSDQKIQFEISISLYLILLNRKTYNL